MNAPSSILHPRSPAGAPAAAPQFDLGLFGHARDLVEVHEVASALRVSEQQVRDLVESGAFLAVAIGDVPQAKRRHIRIKRCCVEAWYIERERAHNGLTLPYRESPEIKFWRAHLAENHLAPKRPE